MNFELSAIISFATVVFAAASVVTLIALRRAPEGVETEEGFFYAPRTVKAQETAGNIDFHHFDTAHPISHSHAA